MDRDARTRHGSFTTVKKTSADQVLFQYFYFHYKSNTCFINDRGISNIDFGDTVVDQGLATQIQHGAFAFVFGESYHSKVLVNDGNLALTNYHTLDQSRNDKYDTVASDLVVPRLIIENSPSTPASMYLRDQYVVNQPKVVNGYGGDKNISNIEYIVSIHPTDYSNGCSKHNDDGTIKLFEYIANNGRASD